MAFNENAYRIQLTPWGKEVKKQLAERNMRQDDIVKYLVDKGFVMRKNILSPMLKGIGTLERRAEIEAISEYLDIPLA